MKHRWARPRFRGSNIKRENWHETERITYEALKRKFEPQERK